MDCDNKECDGYDEKCNYNCIASGTVIVEDCYNYFNLKANKEPVAEVPCSDGLSCRDEIVEKLIKLAAEMATRQGMPSEYVEDWPIPKSTPQKTLNEIERNMEIIQKKIAD